MTTTQLPVFLAGLALLTSASAQAKIEFTTDAYPGGEDHGIKGWIVSRVVDDLTGKPIVGADVFLVAESETPLAGEFWSVREAKTDDDGWLRAPVHDIEKKWHIQVLRHPDYGVCTRSGLGDDVWRIGRPFDVPVRVLDWQGKPAPGARIGFCGGCGHTPDLVNAVADASGLAVLRGIDPQNGIKDVYVQHPGLGLGYDSLQWFPGGPPDIVWCRWSPPVTGKVVDHLGKPVAGAFVASPEVHRGPWAKTGDDGSFTLLGVSAQNSPSLVRLADGKKIWFSDTPPDRYPVTLRLPDPDGDDPTDGTTDAPPGEENAPELRSVRIRLTGREGLIAWADHPRAPERFDTSDEQLEVPASGPFVIHVRVEDDGPGRPGRRSFAFDDASQLPADPVALAWFPPTRVIGTVVDGDGKPVEARVRLRRRWRGAEEDEGNEFVPAAADGAFEMATWQSDLCVLEIVPQRTDLLPRVAWITLPLLGAEDHVDAGKLVLRKEPQLRVLDPAGDPLPNATVGFARGGLQEPGHLHEFPLGTDGTWLGPDLRAGDAVVVHVEEDAVPFRTVLAGDGPWVIRAPLGQLQLQVVGVTGLVVGATVMFGDYSCIVRDEDDVLRGLPLGPLRCHVSANGHQTAIVDTVISAEPQAVRVVLPRW